jgi:hypothetical protein
MRHSIELAGIAALGLSGACSSHGVIGVEPCFEGDDCTVQSMTAGADRCSRSEASAAVEVIEPTPSAALTPLWTRQLPARGPDVSLLDSDADGRLLCVSIAHSDHSAHVARLDDDGYVLDDRPIAAPSAWYRAAPASADPICSSPLRVDERGPAVVFRGSDATFLYREAATADPAGHVYIGTRSGGRDSQPTLCKATSDGVSSCYTWPATVRFSHVVARRDGDVYIQSGSQLVRVLYPE